MGVTLTLAAAADLDRLAALVSLAHPAAAAKADLRARLAPLVEGTPHGAAYLIGPPRAPVGYAIIGFGYAIARGGIEARVSDIFIRAGVRKRGMASEAISALARALAPHGVRAVTLEGDADLPGVAALARRAGLQAEVGHRIFARRL